MNASIRSCEDGAALFPAIERTQPVIGKGKAAKAKKAVTTTPSARTSSLHTGLVLHRDALGDVLKGATVNTTIERPDGISLHVVHTYEPNDKFEEWCARRKKVRSL